MRFGPVPLVDAEGAILAHALRTEGLVLKKGQRLSRDDVAALEAAGVRDVVAAILEPGDLHEDEAAERLAKAVSGPNVCADVPFTGRVNLFAESAGLVRLDPERVDALNLVDEAITLATLPSLDPVRPDQMLATVKIIPFGARVDRVEEAIRIASQHSPLLEVAPFRPLEVALIQTRLPGTKESVLDKTVAVTAARLDAVGGRLISEARTDHAVGALVERVRGTAGGLLLIAGASAITDRKDVLPAAIEAAGGQIEHFGMPVDPGNLLLLGRIGDRPVLGLPGCARSPKLNGFDWVVQRLAAGVPVTRESIMRMGVGGLLMEIPTRPQPRAGAQTKPGRIAALVLAAGQSRRMGHDNKLLLPIDGRPMVARVVDAALRSRAQSVIVVTGYEAGRIEGVLGDREVVFVDNPAYANGLSTSLQAGLEALADDVVGVLVMLGDMPLVSAATIDRLIAAFDPAEGRAIVVPTVRGKRGNPVLFATRFIPEMQAIAGDVGARHLLGTNATEVVEIELDDDAALVDVDTPAAFQALSRAAS